jgi:glycosyltransferase involved in cell wall biosynthesis
MVKEMMKPDYIFESSWEVCNKVGGIYTVLSSRAKTLQDEMKDRIIFIGPDFWIATPHSDHGSEKGNDNDSDKTVEESPYFKEDKSLFAQWQWEAKEQGLAVRVGRWTVPGEPIAILVDFKPFFQKKDEIYTWLWEHYSVDSLHAYGDYDEASMFSYAAALVVESFYTFNIQRSVFNDQTKVIYHANEWMCGLGALYINNKLPQIGTIFTTHATSIGRSIAGNQKPLYDYLFAYNGDQMAGELNMQSKHSIEKQTAWFVDCFTTVSDITAKECVELLDKPVDVVLPNGFDDSFVPKGAQFTKKRKAARKRLLEVANALLGEQLDDNTLIVSTSGRYEFRNKGIDVFVEAMNRLLRDRELKKKVLAFIEVPGWVGEPRKDLQERLSKS